MSAFILINNTKRVGEFNSAFTYLLFTNTQRKIEFIFTTWSIAEKQKLGVADWFVFYSKDRLVYFRLIHPHPQE